MCGHELAAESDDEAARPELSDSLLQAEPRPSAPLESSDSIDSSSDEDRSIGVIESEMREKLSPVTFWLTAAFAVVIAVLGILVLRFPGEATLEFIPTHTPVTSLLLSTATSTVSPTETVVSVESPTVEATILPTETPQPPRSHSVASGETLFGISLRYGVSMESIARANDMPVDSDLQVAQALLVPWPTPTPPLVAVEVEVGGERLIADPGDCEVYEISRGDTLYGIAANLRVPADALLAVNRLTELSILQPGDTICIPKIIYGSTLPSTPGPSPTPGPTSPPPGPQLLYPLLDSTLATVDGPVGLQWVAVKDLDKDEWYMVELTDLTDIDSHSNRAFTQQTSFQLPEDWEPRDTMPHAFRWRISIVRVSGQRDDGSFIYTFGGENSADSFFTWQGEGGSETS
jgi:LysM repeat protein